MRRHRSIVPVLLLFAAGACVPADEAEPPADGPASEPVMPADGAAGGAVADTYAADLNIDLATMTRSETGLYYQDVVVGDGASADAGRTALVHYTGWLPDGAEFDSSRDGDEPLEVVIGEGRVIDGWEEGLRGMRVGGQRRLVIPPDLAYGSQGTGGVIPPDATLVFDVELVEIR